MSRMNLFRHHGIPQSVLSNGVGRFIGQCQRITLKFCKTKGSSRGIREFIENDVVDFAKNFPGVVLYLKPRRHKAPCIVAEYLNGESKRMSVHQKSREEINKWMHLFVRQSGQPEKTLVQKQNTKQPSIQGPWSPFYNRNPNINLVKFPNTELSKPENLQPTASEMLVEIFEKQKADAKQS